MNTFLLAWLYILGQAAPCITARATALLLTSLEKSIVKTAVSPITEMIKNN